MMIIITDSDIDFEATMADAEKGQLNAIQRIHPDSNKLMCFFHVLYNARKRMRSLTPESMHDVYCGIYDMHFTASDTEFAQVSARVERHWRSRRQLAAFGEYFFKEWVRSPFWRWQIYHTPPGYATKKMIMQPTLRIHFDPMRDTCTYVKDIYYPFLSIKDCRKEDLSHLRLSLSIIRFTSGT
jgi:hypothetical protein